MLRMLYEEGHSPEQKWAEGEEASNEQNNVGEGTQVKHGCDPPLEREHLSPTCSRADTDQQQPDTPHG